MSLTPVLFPYRPLATPTEIRLVSLRRGSSTDLVECVLLHTEIQEQPYQALSYEWGLPSDDDPIILMDGVPVRIRTNLHEALRVIRLPDEDVWMWIDFLCINQQDNPERSHQVDGMDKIFSGAERVIVWLGPAKEKSDFAMRRFRETRTLQRLLGQDSFTEAERAALVALAQRSYWSRVWVLQEIYLSRCFLVRCGTKYITDTKLHDALVVFCQHDGQDYCGEIARSTLNQHRLSKQFQRSNAAYFNTLGRWLQVCVRRDLQSSQPRDLIYALLGISHDCPKGTITPDYDKPLLEVYREVAGYWFRSMKGDADEKTSSLRMLAAKLGLDDNEDLARLIADIVSNQS